MLLRADAVFVLGNWTFRYEQQLLEDLGSAETFMRSVCRTEPRTLNVIKRELNALKASIRHTVIKLLQI